MNNINNGSAPPSDTMRDRPPLSADPADSLAYEAEIARAAMAAKFQDLKTSLQTAANPREWAQQHPWAAMGVAAATGFAAATAIASGRKEQRRDDDRRRDQDQEFANSRGGAALSGLTGMLFELAKIFLNSHLIPMFQAWQQGLAEQAIHAAQQTAANPSEPRSAPEHSEAAKPRDDDRATDGRNAHGTSSH